MPPEYVFTMRPAASVSSKRSSSSVGAHPRLRARQADSSPTNTRFWVPVSSSSSVASCPVTPITRRTAAASAGDVEPSHPAGAGVGRGHGGEHADGGRLPGAVRARARRGCARPARRGRRGRRPPSRRRPCGGPRPRSSVGRSWGSSPVVLRSDLSYGKLSADRSSSRHSSEWGGHERRHPPAHPRRVGRALRGAGLRRHLAPRDRRAPRRHQGRALLPLLQQGPDPAGVARARRRGHRRAAAAARGRRAAARSGPTRWRGSSTSSSPTSPSSDSSPATTPWWRSSQAAATHMEMHERVEKAAAAASSGVGEQVRMICRAARSPGSTTGRRPCCRRRHPRGCGPS